MKDIFDIVKFLTKEKTTKKKPITNDIVILIECRSKEFKKQNPSLMKLSGKRKNWKKKFTEINKSTTKDTGVKKTEETKAEEISGIMLYNRILSWRKIISDKFQKRDLKKRNSQKIFENMNWI